MSVIIPVYATAPYVAEALDSVLGQSYSDYEIIVVNDGSPDTSLLEMVLAPYQDRIRYVSQENRGSSGARNTALRLARGHYVAMLDSDDKWHPECLRALVGILEKDSSIDIVYPDAVRFDEGGVGTTRYSEIYPVGGDVSFLRVLTRRCQIYGEVVARKETLVAAGMYDEELTSGEDFELWLRVLKRGGRIVYHDEVLAYYRIRAGSHTSDPMRLIQNVLKLLEKVGREMSLTDIERAALETEREKALGVLWLLEGKEAILMGDHRTAIAKLRLAESLSKSWKLRLAVMGLQLAPGLVTWIYRSRERRENGGLAAVAPRSA